MKEICPICGNKNIQRNIKTKMIEEPFGGQKKIKIVQYTCSDCDASGDFFNENEEKLQKTINQLKKIAVKNTLGYFISKGYSLATLERILELPQRTLRVWKHEIPPAGVTLLKFVRLFPWLLDIVDDREKIEKLIYKLKESNL